MKKGIITIFAIWILGYWLFIHLLNLNYTPFVAGYIVGVTACLGYNITEGR